MQNTYYVYIRHYLVLKTQAVSKPRLPLRISAQSFSESLLKSCINFWPSPDKQEEFKLRLQTEGKTDAILFLVFGYLLGKHFLLTQVTRPSRVSCGPALCCLYSGSQAPGAALHGTSQSCGIRKRVERSRDIFKSIYSERYTSFSLTFHWPRQTT